MLLQNNYDNRINFGRYLSAKESRRYTRNIGEGLRALDKDLNIIIHQASAPSAPRQNTGIGTLASEASEKYLVPFLKKHRISLIQVEPDGLRKLGDPSPYMSDTFGKNPLMIPLERLQQSEYGKILSPESFKKIVEGRTNKKTNRVDYTYVIPSYEKALKESFETFQNKSKNIGSLSKSEAKAIKRLQQGFIEFKNSRGAFLEKNAVYDVLSDIHGNDYWETWNSELDKTLYCPSKGNRKAAKARLIEIKANHAEKIDFYLFKQFLVADTKKKNPMKTIGDSKVAFSPIDVWANQNLFLKKWKLGCPPDYFSKDGQAWDFAVLDPKKLFKKDGSLGPAGKLLSQRYEIMFQDNPGGVRIDHIIGLIDPFVYQNSPTEKNAGRLFSSPKNPELKQYAKKSIEEYCEIIEKIIIPAAKKSGVSSDKIISEDLGDVTKPTADVMKALALRGMGVTQFSNASEGSLYRGKNISKEKIIMLGGHDNIPHTSHVNNLFKTPAKVEQYAKALAEDVLPKGSSKATKERLARKIKGSKREFVAASHAELFTSPAKQIQLFWNDFMGGNKTYNKPGTNSTQNWSLRMSSYFEKQYHQKLKSGEAVNLPRAIATAIAQRGDDFLNHHRKLYDSLQKFAAILEE